MGSTRENIDPTSRQKSHLYRAVFNSATVGLVVFGPDARVESCNPAASALTEYSAGELIGGGFFDLLTEDPKVLRLCREHIEHSFRTRAPIFEYDLEATRKGGGKIHLNLSGAVFFEDGRDHFLLVIQNINSRKAFENIIEGSYDKFIQTTLDLDAALKEIEKQRARLSDVNQRMENELEMARGVQRAFIPDRFPADDTYDLYGVVTPSSALGGDYLDIFHLKDNRLGILIVDVSGHSLPSALVTAMAKVFFANCARQFDDPAQVLERVNDQLGRILRGTGFFVAAVYSVLDLSTMELTTATGGADNPLCYNASTDKIQVLGNEEGGVIMGCFAPSEVHFQSRLNKLEKGSTILYFTDGIVEARNREEVLYGRERLLKFLRENHYLPARQFCEKLLAETDEYYEGLEPNDDRTLIVLNVLKIPGNRREVGAVRDRIRELFNAGQLSFERKDYPAAVETFKSIIELDADSFRAHDFLGRCHTGLGDLERAEREFRRVIELNPNYPDGYYNLGIAYYNGKKYDQARRVWFQLQELSPDFKETNDYLERLEQHLGGN